MMTRRRTSVPGALTLLAALLLAGCTGNRAPTVDPPHSESTTSPPTQSGQPTAIDPVPLNGQITPSG